MKSCWWNFHCWKRFQCDNKSSQAKKFVHLGGIYNSLFVQCCYTIGGRNQIVACSSWPHEWKRYEHFHKQNSYLAWGLASLTFVSNVYLESTLNVLLKLAFIVSRRFSSMFNLMCGYFSCCFIFWKRVLCYVYWWLFKVCVHLLSPRKFDVFVTFKKWKAQVETKTIEKMKFLWLNNSKK